MKNTLNYLLDLVFRERDVCFVCGYKSVHVKRHICGECRENLSFVGHARCGVCGKAVSGVEDKILKCRDCHTVYREFDKAVSPLLYDENARFLIKQFKYHDKPHLKKLFSELIIEELEESGMESADIILGVPLHISRENKRGYNQARLLSDYIGKRLGIESGEGLIKRSHMTKAQNALGRIERSKNLESAFTVEDSLKIKGKKLLLIDDIYTTGATVNEIAKRLKEHGAIVVNVATIATAAEKREERQNGS